MWTVYQHINKINGKRYVGITCKKVKDRWRGGLGYKTQVFYRAIQKYGWDGFEHIIVKDNLPEQCAKTLEKILIFKYDTTNPTYGYNITKGGDGVSGFKFSDNTKQKISQATMGRTPWNKGKTGVYSQDTLNKISKTSKGRVTRTRAMLQYDLNGNFVQRHLTIKDAVSSVGGERSGLHLALRENRPYKNYIWKYE